MGSMLGRCWGRHRVSDPGNGMSPGLRLLLVLVVVSGCGCAAGLVQPWGQAELHVGPRSVRLSDGYAEQAVLVERIWNREPDVALEAAIGLEQLSTHPFGWDLPEGFYAKVLDLVARTRDDTLACDGLDLLARTGREEAVRAAEVVARRVGLTRCVQAAASGLLRYQRMGMLSLLLRWMEDRESSTRLAALRLFEDCEPGKGRRRPDLGVADWIRAELQGMEAISVEKEIAGSR
ncbi:MAG: hypothetical protein FJ098_03130 [Deltaproteobacteria bacterium]|nr:hypothetical protein [Deltaproteobacteria bacterium]